MKVWNHASPWNTKIGFMAMGKGVGAWGPKLSPEWDGPMDYWNDFLHDPPIIFLQCRK